MDSIICYYIKILYYVHVFPNANIERDILKHWNQCQKFGYTYNLLYF